LTESGDSPVRAPRSGGPLVVILFGVAGAGKTLIGGRLATELGWAFYDADSFHSPANVEKMRRGLPLTEEDRGPWLQQLRATVTRCLAAGESAVLACSALKAAYRDYLGSDDRVRFVHLKGDEPLIADRLRQRRGHYFDPELLRSQFDALEEPRAGTLEVDVEASPEQIVETIRNELGLR
jgi:gluconokinase